MATKLQVLLMGHYGESMNAIANHLARIEGFRTELHPACFYLGKVQYPIDQAKQGSGGPVGHAQAAILFFRKLRLLHHLQHS